ncbi:hypothetical protein GCM10027064_16150 [Microbacterium petrolearium]
MAAGAEDRRDDPGTRRPDRAPPQETWPAHRLRGSPARAYKGRNVVERCFNKLKQWRGIAMRSDKTARSYRAAIALAATLIWIKTDLIHTA